MFTARNQFTNPQISAAVAIAMGSQGHGWLAFLNEPDGTGYSVADATTDWNTLVANSDVISSGVKLLSPSMAGGVPAITTWMTPWLAGLNRQPDAIAVHAYTGNNLGSVSAAVTTTNTTINGFASAFPTKDLWLTEFAHNAAGQTPTDAFLKDYANSQCQWNELRAQMTHYAWWTLGPQTRTQESTYPKDFLYDDSVTPSALGVEYRDVCGKHPAIAPLAGAQNDNAVTWWALPAEQRRRARRGGRRRLAA